MSYSECCARVSHVVVFVGRRQLAWISEEILRGFVCLFPLHQVNFEKVAVLGVYRLTGILLAIDRAAIRNHNDKAGSLVCTKTD